MEVRARNGTDVDRYVGFVLTSGVVLSLVVLVWGAVLYLANPGAPEAERSVAWMLKGVASLDPTATINLGLLILLLTPVVRIIAAGIAFVMERAYKFALVSLGVLAILSVSTVIGYFSGRH